MNTLLAYNSPALQKFRPPTRQVFRFAQPVVVDRLAFAAGFQDAERRRFSPEVLEEFSSNFLEDITETVELQGLEEPWSDEREVEAEGDGVIAYSRKAHALFHLTWLTFLGTVVAIVTGHVLGEHIWGVVGAAIGTVFMMAFFACIRQASDERDRGSAARR